MSGCGKCDHCCWFSGKLCEFLIISDKKDFSYACSLRVKYGSWGAAHKSNDYQQIIKPKMASIGYEKINCGDWPPDDVVCHTCGKNVNDNASNP